MLHYKTISIHSWPDASLDIYAMHIIKGLKFNGSQTDTAFSRVWDLLKESRSPVFHAIGNHEFYNFKITEIRDRFNVEGGAQVEATQRAATQNYAFDCAITYGKKYNFELKWHIWTMLICSVC